MAETSLVPELLAVIRRQSDGKTLVVVKRGGRPQHVSEIIPVVLESATRFGGAIGTVLESGLNTPRTDA